ncbi:MAG TPA: VOC family protein [Actinomycetota bacterium]|jgi:predicted enzyme related to lactoylglutathione lyase|nr:VOC family protein [Actinomycetota bacterium]
MGRPVVHFEIMGKDGKELAEFYSELFGWNVDANNEYNYGVIAREDNLNAEGIGIGGGIGSAMNGGDGYVTVYVEVPDVEATLAKAESLGAKRLMGPETMTGNSGPMTLGMFADAEGHTIGVIGSS